MMGLGDFTGAKAQLREAVAIAERTLHARHPIIGAACIGLAAIARYEHRYDDAATQSARAVAIYADTKHPDQGLAELHLGLAHLGQGRDADALTMLATARDHLAERRNRDDTFYWFSHGALGFARLRNGDSAGLQALQEALAELEKPERARGNQHAEALGMLAQAAALQGDAAGARDLRVREAEALAQVLGENHPRTRSARRQLR
jgi:tetratricopeptide (TPR) repeat protein